MLFFCGSVFSELVVVDRLRYLRDLRLHLSVELLCKWATGLCAMRGRSAIADRFKYFLMLLAWNVLLRAFINRSLSELAYGWSGVVFL